MFDFRIGQSASLARTFRADEVWAFVELIGGPDTGHVVPAGLIGGLFSQLLGTSLPGRGTNWMKQSLRFLAPPHIDEAGTARVQVVRLRPEKQLVNLKVECSSPAGALRGQGQTLVFPNERAQTRQPAQP